MRVFKKHVSGAEKVAAVIFWAFLLLVIVTQVFFDGDVLLLMAIFAVLAIMVSLVLFLPELYEFREKSFCISKPKLKKEIDIPYGNIMKYEAVGMFRQLKREFDSAEIILTYTPADGGRKRTVLCHPKNVLGFVKTLQERCPNLQYEEDLFNEALPENGETGSSDPAKPDSKEPVRRNRWWSRRGKGNDN